jgi:hypothetical protein
MTRRLVDSREIHLETSLLASDWSGAYTVVLDPAIETGQPGQWFSLQISSLELPYTWHDFSEALDTSLLFVDDTAALELVGWYTAEEIAIEISTLPWATVTYRQRDGRLVIKNTSDTSHTMNCGYSRLCYFLGLWDGDATIAAGATAVAPGVLSTSTVKAVYLHCNLPGQATYQVGQGTYGIALQSLVVDKIPVTVNPLELLCYGGTSTSDFETKFVLNELRGFQFSLSTESGHPLQLNGRSVSLTFQVDVFSDGESYTSTMQAPINQLQSGLGSFPVSMQAGASLLGGTDTYGYADDVALNQSPAELPVAPAERPDDGTDLRLKARILADRM